MERNGQLNRHQVAQSFDMKARSNSQLNPAYKHNAAEVTKINMTGLLWLELLLK